MRVTESPRLFYTRGGAIWRIGAEPFAGADRRQAGKSSMYRRSVPRHGKARLVGNRAEGRAGRIGLYATLIIIIVVAVIVAVAPAVLRPVRDVIAESVFDPVGIVCHIDHSVSSSVRCSFHRASHRAYPPPAGDPSSTFFSIFLLISSISPLCRIYGFAVSSVHLRRELLIYQ